MCQAPPSKNVTPYDADAESSWRPPEPAEQTGQPSARSLDERLPNGLQAILERNVGLPLGALRYGLRSAPAYSACWKSPAP